ncbi:hypothetical protein VPH184E373B_0199 [Vibrio phage 184E37-3b]|nr:hypothetical protein MYOV056v2_p0175 [Vibrio phage 184E37.3a]
MEKVTTYKLSNGKEIASEAMAELGQKIIQTNQEIRNLTKHLNHLNSLCTCEELVKSGSPRQNTRTILNSWGEDCGEVYTTQPYVCKVCNATWYHGVESDEWIKW